MTKTEKLQFKISGDFITKQARTFVLENIWEDGLSLLKDCVCGCSYEIAISILRGEKKFTGINTLELEDEDTLVTKELNEQLNFAFCGIFKDGKKYWVPYAYVDSWCEKDLNRKTMSANIYYSFQEYAIPYIYSDKYKIWNMSRNNFYMDDPINNKAILLNIKNKNKDVVLWKEIRVPPPWIKTFKTPQEALNDFLKNKQLQHRGAHQFIDYDIYKKNVDKKDKEGRIKIVKRLEEKEDRDFKERYDEIVPQIKNYSLDIDCGWLSPEGKLIPCLYYEHDWFALVILKELYNIDNGNGDLLIKKGWLKLQQNNWYPYEQVTQKQYDTIWDYSLVHNLKMLKVEVK